MSQSVDSMLGIINNANQTATILDAQRNIGDSLRSTAERNILHNGNQTTSIIDTQRNIGDTLRSATERNINALMQNITSEHQ